MPTAASAAHAAVSVPRLWHCGNQTPWREFAAGMTFLARYASHNTGDPTAIALGNLRILHRSLLQQTRYQHLIGSLRRDLDAQALPRRFDLDTPEGLQASLLGIPAHRALRIGSRPGYQRLFLVVHGSARVLFRDATPPVRHTWQRLLGRRPESRHRRLHPDDAISLAHGNGDLVGLETTARPCILLTVETKAPDARPHPPRGRRASSLPPPPLRDTG